MYQIFGILLILYSLSLASWKIKKEDKVHGPFYVFCYGIIFIGLLFVFSDRIVELSVENFGSIKMATKQAQADAKVIRSLKKEITEHANQIKTISMKASKADETIQKLESLTKSFIQLPDGRCIWGNRVMGDNKIIKNNLIEASEMVLHKEFSAAYNLSNSIIEGYETAESIIKREDVNGASIPSEIVGEIYYINSLSAIKLNLHDSALRSARMAFEHRITGKTIGILYVALMNKGIIVEAKAVSSKILNYSENAQFHFKQELDEHGYSFPKN
ncbi:hypothetical protein K8T06_11280 [bacterium]|nr:hypothetical protein [bacterium]